MFADDTYITTAHEDISTIQYSLNSDLTTVHNWLKTKKKMSCNTSYRGAMAWNQLSKKTRELGNLTSFKLAIS